jgi:intein/homing endonuclease
MKNLKSSEKLFSQRVFFKIPQIREQFFLKLKYLFGTWKKLGLHFKIYKSRMERFREGKISLPYKLFSELLSSLDNEDKSFFLKNILLRDPNWGRAKGGIATYQKHKYIFEKGRRLGGLKVKYKFDFNMALTPELCEFIGAIIGDGFTNNYNNNYKVQITGHKVLDKDYYINRLIPIVKLLSSKSNPILSQSSGALRLTLNSKELHILLTKRFNIKAGKKAYCVVMPEEIIDSKNPAFINSCIRGVFDTDGCVAFDKRQSYLKPYLRIVLQMESTELIKQIHMLLREQGINSTITKDERVIQINGVNNCRDYLRLIGFSNKRHLSKLKKISL